MNKNNWTIYKSIWFWWIFTTIIYSSFGFWGYPGSYPTFMGHIAGFVGLFVPYGFASMGYFFFSPYAWISLAIFIVLMIYIERKLNKHDYKLGKRILLNLLALLILTMIVDLVRLTPFESWVIFINGVMPSISG